MKKISIFAIFTTVLMLFAGCDVLEDTAIPISLGEQTFSFNIESLESIAQDTRSAQEGYRIKGSKTIKLTDPMFSELNKYLGDKIVFEVSNLKMKVTPAEGYSNLSITSFEASASGVNPGYTKDIVPVGQVFSDNALTTFINKAIAETVSSEEVTIGISGRTNIEESAQIGKIDITFKLTAKVYLLK